VTNRDIDVRGAAKEWEACMIFLEKNPTPTNESAEIDSSALIAAVPHLRAFARLLRGDPERADDLVQETVVLALTTSRHFLPENDLKLWLFSLLRDLYHRDLQTTGAGHEAFVCAETPAPGIACQEACCASGGFSLAFVQLRDEEREVLILVEAADLTYAEAASVCNCSIGTIKSRVSRARRRLLRTLVAGAAQATIGSANELLV
jgi:RNA polymerase sigma-70 factor (ECF subfamily)